MKRIIVSTALSFAVGSIALACSSSSNGNKGGSPSTNTDAGSQGGSTSGGGSSNGGGANNGGGGATSNGGTSNGGTSNGGATGNDKCDKTACQNTGFQGLTACCVNDTTCGVSSPQFMGGACNAIPKFDAGALHEPIVIDPSCPDLELPEAGLGGGGFFDAGSGGALKGCCDKTNVCGFAFSASFGGFDVTQCVTPADAARLGMGMGGGNFDAGPSKPCTYKAP